MNQPVRSLTLAHGHPLFGLQDAAVANLTYKPARVAPQSWYDPRRYRTRGKHTDR